MVIVRFNDDIQSFLLIDQQVITLIALITLITLRISRDKPTLICSTVCLYDA